MGPGLDHALVGEVEHAPTRRGISAAFFHDVHEVLEVSATSVRYYRNCHSLSHRARELQVIALHRALAIDRRQQDLPSPEVNRSLGPLDRVEAGRLTACIGEDLVSTADPPHVNGQDHALIAEAPRCARDQIRVLDRCRVDADLVGTGVQQSREVLDPPHSPTDAERHEALLGDLANDLQGRAPRLGAGGDVEENQLIGTLRIVDAGRGKRVARITKLTELPPLDTAALEQEQGGDQTLLEYRENLRRDPT